MGEHIRIHPQCGACSFAIIASEAVVALVKGNDYTITAVSAAIIYDDSSYCENGYTTEWVYCRCSNCKECASSAPTITVHKECLDFLEQLSAAEDRLSWLWTAAAWRSPWNGAPPLHQALSPSIDVGQFIDQAAQACAMPSLSFFPKELALMIYERTNESCLHRHLSFWSYARWWNLGHSKTPETIPINEIEEWHRGSHPTMIKDARHDEVESDVQKPIIILSIDSQGLQSIKRVQKGYTNANDNLPQPGTVVYVAEAAECFASAHVEYNYPFARLQLTGRPEQFRVWDTPSPPQWQECVIDTNYDSTSAKSHLSTIDTHSSTGLTFFICYSSVWAIHTHTKSQPSAQPTFNTLSPKIQPFVQWVYVPLGTEDTITTFGWSRSYYNARFYLRLKLAGDIIVGSTYKMRDEDVQLIQHPLTLMYQRPDGEAVTFIGGYSDDTAPLAALQLEDKDTEAEPAFTFQYRKQPFRSASYSSAPLNNVCRAQVFYERGASACRGIVLEYRDGSKQALGQCKLGVDQSEECIEPSQLCYTSLGKNSLQVKFYDGSSHRHEEPDWTCCPMRGVLEFWFSDKEVKLN
ncbi:hypothetical protein GGI43DRAFT_379061 [Trichoderma evansii]